MVQLQTGLQIPSMEELHHFCVNLSFSRIFLKENNSSHHFYCQIERTFTGQLVAAVLDKGKDVPVV